jgi:hypothetical protein
MTRKRLITLFGIFVLLGTLWSQESPTPTVSPNPSQTPPPSPASSPTRSVRLRFVPPPLEGTITLGIYDSAGKIVRVLHQQASLDAFTIGADALETKWDGKDDDGQDLPSGKYHARGYAVGDIQLENVGTDPTQSPPPSTNNRITIKLTPNPLVKNDRPSIDLTVGFDDTDSFLQSSDGLGLYIISERSDITGIVAAKNGEKSIDVWQESGAGTERFRISKLDQMMAFDCGSFDLK